ncbi:MAG: purine-nucleoside phosphorylase [Verrucomicrobiota bacterium]|jgi:purine-nucleoside phosphorylase
MRSAAERLHEWRADTAIILGSGLSSIVTDVDDEIPYAEFGEIPKPSVPGHAARFVLGKIDNKNVIFAQGRVHLYEGNSAHEVTSIVRVLAATGIRQLILTNAAGSLNPNFKPGSWMMITDQINLTGSSPLVGDASPARTFIDMSDAYSPRLRENFRAAAAKIDIKLQEGVYAGVLGPQYETPAEVKMLRSLGADAVGMSTVLETIQTRALGLEVAGFSCLTNLAAGLSKEKLSHEEVLAIGKSSAQDFAKLLDTAFGK